MEGVPTMDSSVTRILWEGVKLVLLFIVKWSVFIDYLFSIVRRLINQENNSLHCDYYNINNKTFCIGMSTGKAIEFVSSATYIVNTA